MQFEYDAVGRVTKQILPDLREINFTYDDNGNVTSITPPGRPQHSFAYDAVNLETDYDPPNIGLSQHATQFSYNLDRQLTSILRPDGQTISLGYDTGGRLSTVTIPFGAGTGDYTYSYDAATGNLTGITSPAGEGIGFGYDGSLLLGSTWTGTVSGSVSRTYDNDFRITSRSVNGANTISFGYDADSLLTSAGSETLTYDPANGLLTGTTLGVVDDAFAYNGFGEVSSYSADVSGTPVFATDFVRDKLGRIVQKTETVNGVQHVYDYAYDTAGRLVEVKKDSVVTATYSYDANGNRLNNGATYDDQDRLTSTGTASYTYTANGELLSKTEGADTTQYSYDVLGNLLSVTLPDGTLIEYVVDGRNRRIGKKVNGVLTKAWLYKDGLNPIAELDGAGNVVSRFVYGSRFNVPDYVIKSGVTYRIVSDHLGSPRQVINTTDGTVIQQIDYDEWGSVAVDTNPGFIPFGFAGGIYDQDTKLVKFGARDYDSNVGRWTNKDPIGFSGGDPNLYGYTLNNPINFVDFYGLEIRYGPIATEDKKFQKGFEALVDSLAETCDFGKELADLIRSGSVLVRKVEKALPYGYQNQKEIGINLNYIGLIYVKEENGTTGLEETTQESVLAHELGHALTIKYDKALEWENAIRVNQKNPKTGKKYKPRINHEEGLRIRW